MQTISVSKLEKSFGKNRVLKGTSFDIEARTITGIIGPNGAGKTTCFNCITGDVSTNGGKVRLGDEDISNLSARKIYDLGLHRTFQIPLPFMTISLVENVMLPHARQRGERWWNTLARLRSIKRQETEIFEKAMDALRTVNLEKMALEPAEKLSGGQKKLLELARAVVNAPKVLLLDEPTAGVNPALADKLCEYLIEFSEQRELTLLMITHDMSVVRKVCKKVIVMVDGEVLAEDTAEGVIRNKRVQEAYLGGTGNGG